MRTVTVKSPDGATWRVRVRWEPRWRALARRFGGWRRRRKNEPVGDGGPDLSGLDLPPGTHHSGGGFFSDLFDDIFIGIAILIALLLFGFVFWWLLLPLLLLLLDAIVVAVLLIAGITARVLFRRPWLIEVTGPVPLTAGVVGWRQALNTRDDIADKLRLGYRPQDLASEAHQL